MLAKELGLEGGEAGEERDLRDALEREQEKRGRCEGFGKHFARREEALIWADCLCRM